MLSARWVQTWWFSFLVVAALPTFWTFWFVLSGYVLSGDNAWIALRTFDIFSTNPPLTGMPSTSGLDAPGVSAYHPGPIHFMLLAPFYAISGWSPSGLALVSLAINLAMIGIGLWATWRIDVPLAKVAVVGAYIVVILGEQFKLMHPWNPRPVELSMVALVVLVWAIMIGQRGYWPWFVLVASIAAQGHLLGLPISAFAVLTLIVLSRRFGAPARPTRSELAVSVALLIAAWLLPLWDIVSNWPGNLGEIIAYVTAGRSGEETVDTSGTIRLALWVITYATLGWLTVRQGIARLRLTSSDRNSLRLGAGLLVTGTMLFGLVTLLLVGGTGRLGYFDMVTGVFWLGLFLLVFQPRVSHWKRILVVALVAIGSITSSVDNLLSFMDFVRENREQYEIVGAARNMLADADKTPIVVEHHGSYSWMHLYSAIILDLSVHGRVVHYDPLGRPEQYDTQRRISEVDGQHVTLVISDQRDGSTGLPEDARILDVETFEIPASEFPVTVTVVASD